MENSSSLPLYFRRSGARQSRLETPVSQLRSSSLSPHKFVHTIPLIVLMSFFILWWFSHPVNLVFKDGRIKEIHQTATLSLNGTYVELAILASAESPVNSTPLNLTRNNETLAHSEV
ncbi:uncharacterized protein LOC123226056 isoform X2 [Mangifera indica]|uniref:uncharacterized protein LOC123226056 isoform X2 n=1 Tax=Mangifera indica TaxID=29780 RepID=UPI001CF95A77|nr:uncharacterized protein LOC123226056 isoform X2 [Mangifera indica]